MRSPVLFLTVLLGVAGRDGGGICSRAVHLESPIEYPFDLAHRRILTPLELIDSTIANNHSRGSGGGLASTTAFRIARGFVESNDADSFGGGLFVDAPPGAIVRSGLDHVEVTRNRVNLVMTDGRLNSGGGGGIAAAGPVALRFVELFENRTPAGGGALWVGGPSADVGVQQSVLREQQMASLSNQGLLDAYFPFILADRALLDLRAVYGAAVGAPKPIEKD